LGNFLLAILIFAGTSMIFTDVTYDDGRIFIFDRTETVYPAEAAGLQDGDRIITINGQAVNNFSEISDAIASSDGKVMVEYTRPDVAGLLSTEIQAQETEGGFVSVS
jgi:membrane-associated protease RseP (regulator of RpoE activity)